MNTYATTLYGANTWDLFSSECEKLYRSYNVAIRQIFHLNRCTHRYLIEGISESLHLKTMLASRFVTFYRSLVTTDKTPVRFLARICENDQRTVLGKTLSELLVICGLDSNDVDKLTASIVKKNMLYQPVLEENRWRIASCRELIGLRQNDLHLVGFEENEIKEMLNFICVT